MLLRENLASVEHLKPVILSNPAIQQKLAQAPNRTAFVKLALEYCHASGLNLTNEQLNQAIDRRIASNRVEMWLNDELLESVAGNQAKQSDTGTCTCVGCSTVGTLGCHTGSGCGCSR